MNAAKPKQKSEAEHVLDGFKTFALIMCILGGISLGLRGLKKKDMVQFLFHKHAPAQKAVYITIGASALFLLGDLFVDIIKHSVYTPLLSDDSAKKKN